MRKISSYTNPAYLILCYYSDFLIAFHFVNGIYYSRGQYATQHLIFDFYFDDNCFDHILLMGRNE